MFFNKLFFFFWFCIFDVFGLKSDVPMGFNEESGQVKVCIDNLQRFLDLHVNNLCSFPQTTGGCQSLAILSLRHNHLSELPIGKLNMDSDDNILQYQRRSVQQPEGTFAWKRNLGMVMLCLFFICGGRTDGGSISNNKGGRSGGCGKKQQQQQQSSRGGGGNGGKRPNGGPQKKSHRWRRRTSKKSRRRIER